jgi:glucose-6-phosphate 1-dehydrogenase
MPGLRSFIDGKGPFGRVVFFLALPPEAYASTAAELHAQGFGPEAALIIEKPFGRDYASSRALNTELAARFGESQIFRIDHYLAKEAVQNILVFRFANSVFYPVWNSRYIESIQINAAETIGVGDRGAYFDTAGIVRDMVQNHLVQLLCLMTMEAPVSLEAEEIRAQKINVLKAITADACCRGQYRGYQAEKGVAPGSTTETYAELQLSIHAFRWAGMPVYIRVGKALDRIGTEIGVRFRPLPRLLFNADGSIPPNRIVFRIQPAEGIILDLSSKAPGEGIQISDTTMRFCYRDAFAGEIPEAYQRLLLDAIRGDRTLFVSAEETELSWKMLGPVLDTGEVRPYERGSSPEPCLYRNWIDFGKYQSVCE